MALTSRRGFLSPRTYAPPLEEEGNLSDAVVIEAADQVINDSSTFGEPDRDIVVATLLEKQIIDLDVLEQVFNDQDAANAVEEQRDQLLDELFDLNNDSSLVSAVRSVFKIAPKTSFIVLTYLLANNYVKNYGHVEITRRDFLKLGLGIVGAAALIIALGGCAPQPFTQVERKSPPSNCETEPVIDQELLEARELIFNSQILGDVLTPDEMSTFSAYQDGLPVDENILERTFTKLDLLTIGIATKVGSQYAFENIAQSITPQQLQTDFPELVSALQVEPTGGNIISLDRLNLHNVRPNSPSGGVYKVKFESGRTAFVRLTSLENPENINMVRFGNDLNRRINQSRGLPFTLVESEAVLGEQKYLATVVEQIGVSMDEAKNRYTIDQLTTAFDNYFKEAAQQIGSGMFKKDINYGNLRLWEDPNISDPLQRVRVVDIDYPQRPVIAYHPRLALQHTYARIQKAMTAKGYPKGIATLDEYATWFDGQGNTSLANMIRESSILAGSDTAKVVVRLKDGSYAHTWIPKEILYRNGTEEQQVMDQLRSIEEQVRVGHDASPSSPSLMIDDATEVVMMKAKTPLSRINLVNARKVLKMIGVGGDLLAIASLIATSDYIFDVILRDAVAFTGNLIEYDSEGKPFYHINLDFLWDRAKSVTRTRAQSGVNTSGYNISDEDLNKILGVLKGETITDTDREELRWKLLRDAAVPFAIIPDNGAELLGNERLRTPMYYTATFDAETNMDLITVYTMRSDDFESYITGVNQEPALRVSAIYSRPCKSSTWEYSPHLTSQALGGISYGALPYPMVNFEGRRGQQDHISGSLLPLAVDNKIIIQIQ